MHKVYQADYKNYVLEQLKDNPVLGKKVISAAYLRQELALANNQTRYEFDFISSNPVTEFPQVKLNDKDVFVATHMALLLFVVNTNKEGIEKPFAYPNSEVFAQTGVTVADLEAIYNGYITVQIDQTEHVTRLFSGLFRETPETYTEATALNLDHDSNNGLPGLRKLDQSLILNGLQENKFSLVLPKLTTTPAWQTSATDTEIRVGIFLDGFMIKGASQAHYTAIQQAVMG